MKDVCAPVSKRKLPVVLSVPSEIPTGGVPSLVPLSSATGLGPMNGLESSVGPAAPVGVVVVKPLNDPRLNFTWRLVEGIPGSESAVAEWNGVPGLYRY